MFSTRFGHHERNELKFNSDDTAHTHISQRGLYGRKTHGPKYKVCFSDKRHRYHQQPNVHKRKYYSDILQKYIRLPVTTYVMKNIIKAGSFDNYILHTKDVKMNSKMGLFLRDLMQKKLANPDFELPYIPFQANVARGKGRRPKYLLNLPAIYVPAHVRQTQDMTKYHLKQADEMTRDEMATWEKVFKDPDIYYNMDKEWKKKQPYFQEVRAEILALQPVRHNLIKKYWEKNKYSPKGREWILKMAEESEEFPKYMLEEEYIYFRDAIPEINEFLDEIERQKQQAVLEEKKTALGHIQLKIGGRTVEFNPFAHQPEQKKERIKDVRKEYKA